MTATIPTLCSPPIVEMVVDIECDFAPRQSSTGLGAVAGKFRDRYPKERKLLVQEFKIGLGAESTFQFLQDDEKQLVQVRARGFSFNRLAPYGSFDEYLPEIRRTWEIYRELALPILVRMVRLRYINRLSLPFTDQQLDLDSYFKTGPRIPDEDHLAVAGFLNQHQLVERETGYHIKTVLAAGNVEEDELPVIFDNTVAARVDSEPADWQPLEATIQSLRNLKNRVFFGALTDKCLDLFK
jgi:uncharacterized protein (TIGR04255 family)